jgi:hypothetical protein
MNHAWRIGSGHPTAHQTFTLEHVLLEYDGPQVVTARDQYESRYLGVAVDDSDDGESIRWVYSQISDMEFDAIVSGGATLRDALEDDTVFVADVRVDGGIVENVWRVNGADVPPGALPRSGSFLPLSVQQRFIHKRSAQPTVRVSGKTIKDSKISFGDLGYACTRKQDLWNALFGSAYFKTKKVPSDRYVGGEFLPSTMLVAGTGSGSFVINVQPADETIFAKISDEYKKLLEMGTDETAIRQTFGDQVLRSYTEYMAFLDARKIEVLTTSNRTTSYVGPKKSARVVSALGKRRPRAEAPPEAQETPSFQVVGYFEGYSYAQKLFDFVVEESRETYTGTVEESVLTRTPIDRGLVLSSKMLYVAEIKTSKRGDRTTHHLLGFWRHVPPP